MKPTNTLVTVHCYAGDKNLVERHLPFYEHHGHRVLILSPRDSGVSFFGKLCMQAGHRAYIGQDSLDRQIYHMKLALEFPAEFFLMNDADSLCVSPQIPEYLYNDSNETIWSNEVVEPRPHESPYPKIAMQPPYFLTRKSLEKIVKIASLIKAHPITPYIDWAMLAWSYEAGLRHLSFQSKEKQIELGEPPSPAHHAAERIRRCGMVMLHPVKTAEDLTLWKNAYIAREQ